MFESVGPCDLKTETDMVAVKRGVSGKLAKKQRQEAALERLLVSSKTNDYLMTKVEMEQNGSCESKR